MAGTCMATAAAPSTMKTAAAKPAATKATASAADISAATVVSVITVTTIVVVAAAAERAANYPGNDAADDRRTNSRIVAIVNLFEAGIVPDFLQCGRVDWCSRDRHEAKEQADAYNCGNSNRGHATIFRFREN